MNFCLSIIFDIISRIMSHSLWQFLSLASGVPWNVKSLNSFYFNVLKTTNKLSLLNIKIKNQMKVENIWNLIWFHIVTSCSIQYKLVGFISFMRPVTVWPFHWESGTKWTVQRAETEWSFKWTDLSETGPRPN